MNAETNYTFGTLFTGGAGADVGIEAAGGRHLWGLELDDEIASVARMNGFNVRVENITFAEPSTFEPVDCLHASPPCPSFSVAKTGGKETANDIALAQRVAEFIRVLRPRIFTLENVWKYRLSQSWALIQACLQREGYAWAAWHLNMADWGVPSTRKRMIVAAVLGARYAPTRPPQTHAEDTAYSGGGLFPDEPIVDRWVSWYEAIEDLLPGCPDSELAPWQKKRLPKEFEALLFLTGNTSDVQAAPGVSCQQKHQPAATVHTHRNGSRPRAILVGAGGFQGEVVTAAPTEPAFTVTANHNQQTQVRAVLAMSGNANLTDDRPLLSADQPANTVSGAGGGRGLPKAVLVDGENAGPGRAVLLSSQSIDGGEVAMRGSEEPSISIGTNADRMRAVLIGARVVQLTPRCLARFQSVPDSYVLPSSKRLACKVIGNMIPPLFTQKLYEHLLNTYDETP